MASIMIAGTKSGVGKTTITMGILAALSKDRVVQPYKVGPDYIDPTFHTQITGRSCRNLDSYLLTDETIKYLYEATSEGADISVIEGVMGLFDGKEVGSDIGTSASIAKLVSAPIILVVDGSKVATSIAATVRGFATFQQDITVAGVILNNVGSTAHYELLRDAILHHTDVIPCGYLMKDTELTLPERHLGLVPQVEMNEVASIYENLAKAIEATVDLDAICHIAKLGVDRRGISESLLKDKRCIPYEQEELEKDEVRIAIARDQAFHFYYQDNLDYLTKDLGVRLIPFSPLEDTCLPEDIHGLIIGGGFPEMFAKELAENKTILQSIHHALDGGLPYSTYHCKPIYSRYEQGDLSLLPHDTYP